MLKVFGLKNCDSCRNAMKWLEKSNIQSKFYDFRDKGICRELVVKWIELMGWKNLLNRRSTTWRNLPEKIRQSVDGISVIALIVQKPALIKRPVFEYDGKTLIGFKDQQKKELKKLLKHSRL